LVILQCLEESFELTHADKPAGAILDEPKAPGLHLGIKPAAADIDPRLVAWPMEMAKGSLVSIVSIARLHVFTGTTTAGGVCTRRIGITDSAAKSGKSGGDVFSPD
jgi:hypothetical protein